MHGSLSESRGARGLQAAQRHSKGAPPACCGACVRLLRVRTSASHSPGGSPLAADRARGVAAVHGAERAPAAAVVARGSRHHGRCGAAGHAARAGGALGQAGGPGGGEGELHSEGTERRGFRAACRAANEVPEGAGGRSGRETAVGRGGDASRAWVVFEMRAAGARVQGACRRPGALPRFVRASATAVQRAPSLIALAGPAAGAACC